MIFKLGLVLYSSTFHNAQRREHWSSFRHHGLSSFIALFLFAVVSLLYLLPSTSIDPFFYISHPFPFKFLLYPLLFLSYSFVFLPILSDFLTLLRSSFWFLIISNPPNTNLNICDWTSGCGGQTLTNVTSTSTVPTAQPKMSFD